MPVAITFLNKGSWRICLLLLFVIGFHISKCMFLFMLPQRMVTFTFVCTCIVVEGPLYVSYYYLLFLCSNTLFRILYVLGLHLKKKLLLLSITS